jgi:hypothetical protein
VTPGKVRLLMRCFTTLAAPPNPQSESAAPIPPRATIYRPQLEDNVRFYRDESLDDE